MDYKACEMQLKATGSRGEFEGLAAAYRNVDRAGDVIYAPAVENLAEFERRGSILLDHARGQPPVAAIVAARESEEGLWVKAKWHSDSRSQQARAAVAERLSDGLGVGMSIGYETTRSSRCKATGARRLDRLMIHECSILLGSMPCNVNASVLSVKGVSPMTAVQQLEDWRARLESVTSPVERLAGKIKAAAGNRDVSIEIKADDLFDPIAASLRLSVPPSAASDPAFGMLPYVRRASLPAGEYVVTYYRVSPVTGARTVARGTLKPVLELVTQRVDASAQTIAAALIVTRQALADVPTLEALINDSLRGALRLELANQVLNGTGTPPDLTGVMTDASVTQTASGDLAAAVIKGATLLRAQGIRPSVAVVSPADASAYLQAKTTHYDVSLGVETIAGVPVAYEAAMPAGQGLVLGDGAITVWTKGEGRVTVGTQGTQITENKATVVGDLEALVTIDRPQAIVKLAISAPA